MNYNLKNKQLKLNNGKSNICVFDVESDGFYGPTIAFSALIISFDDGTHYNQRKKNPIIIDSLTLKSKEDEKNISCEWVKENVIPGLKFIKSVNTNKELRTAFFNFYMKYKESLYGVYSDVNFPVETNFLAEIAKDNIEDRQFKMPYPLWDIASITKDNETTRSDFYIKKNAWYIIQDIPSRKPKEHNPYWDALCSAYFLLMSK